MLLSLAGEIEDEDSTLAERQEARAERFTGYSGKRASESAQALDEVERLAAMIPPGQPILVGITANAAPVVMRSVLKTA